MEGKLQSDYCYPGTDVLINRFGVRTWRELDVLENEFSLKKINDLLSAPELTLNKFGVNTLLHIHRYLFEDVYDWAGKLRHEEIAKDGVRFGAVNDIRNAITDVACYIDGLDGLKSRSPEYFVQDIALVHSRLMGAHPFREGNGRTIRTFLEILARSAGYELFYNNVDREQQIQADRLAMGKYPSIDGLVLMYAQMALPSESPQKIKLTGSRGEAPFSFPNAVASDGKTPKTLKEVRRLGISGGRC